MQIALQLLLAKMAKLTVVMMRMVVRTEAIRIFLAVASMAGFGGNILTTIINQIIIVTYFKSIYIV